jgi:hypothetical protein
VKAALPYIQRKGIVHSSQEKPVQTGLAKFPHLLPLGPTPFIQAYFYPTIHSALNLNIKPGSAGLCFRRFVPVLCIAAFLCFSLVDHLLL